VPFKNYLHSLFTVTSTAHLPSVGVTNSVATANLVQCTPYKLSIFLYYYHHYHYYHYYYYYCSQMVQILQTVQTNHIYGNKSTVCTHEEMTNWTHTDDTVERTASSSLLKSVLAWTAAMMSGWSCCMACIARLQYQCRWHSSHHKLWNNTYCWMIIHTTNKLTIVLKHANEKLD